MVLKTSASLVITRLFGTTIDKSKMPFTDCGVVTPKALTVHVPFLRAKLERWANFSVIKLACEPLSNSARACTTLPHESLIGTMQVAKKDPDNPPCD